MVLHSGHVSCISSGHDERESKEKRWWDATCHRFPKIELEDFPRYADHTPCTRYPGPITWTEMVFHSGHVSGISLGHLGLHSNLLVKQCKHVVAA